ncbi:MAG: GDSL family lipase [Oscillospiraceae bacterium]|nr:GDSL family lipase [Oscillospiraceae bacterium]
MTCILLLSACGQPAAQTPATAAETAVTAAKPARFTEKVKTLGRTYDDGNTLWLGFSGTGADFTVSGKTCKITVAGCSNAIPGGDNLARLAVYVDGERVLDELIDRKEKEFTVFDNDTSASHEVRIVKLSECAHSVCGIKAVTTDGEITPSPSKAMTIEFIGDSITCGYGVDDEVKEHHFSTETEDCTKAYAMKTAEKLDADAYLVSLSGYGIISGYSDGKTQQKNQIIPKYYDKFGYSYTTFGDSSTQPSSIEWDHSKVQPDVIVINLGTNDASWTKTEEDRLNEYMEKYKEFVKHIREVHPDSHIVCTLGIMGDSLYPYIEYAVQGYVEETGDKKIHTMKFDVQSPEDGYAADWHPTEATHEKAAEKLAEFIRSECK